MPCGRYNLFTRVSIRSPVQTISLARDSSALLSEDGMVAPQDLESHLTVIAADLILGSFYKIKVEIGFATTHLSSDNLR
jgi:hypothetical protein